MKMEQRKKDIFVLNCNSLIRVLVIFGNDLVGQIYVFLVKVVKLLDICFCRVLEVSGYLERFGILQVFNGYLMEWFECFCISQEWGFDDFRVFFDLFSFLFC